MALTFGGVVATGGLSAGALAAATFCPIGGVVAASLTHGILRDCQHGSTRNTSEAVVGSFCAVGGGVAAAAQGAAIGTAVCPGVGTAVGAVAGSLMGAAGGDYAGKKAASEVFDYYEYEIKVFRCRKCSRRFKCRVYTSQSRRYCANCDDDFVIGCSKNY